MNMSIVELLFVMSLFLPAVVVVLGAVFLMMPWGRQQDSVSVRHAHAH